MKLGLLTACMPERVARGDRRLGRRPRLRGARARRLAAARRPPVRRPPPRRRRVRRRRGRAGARARSADNGLELSALAYYDNNLHPDPAQREAIHAHLRACIDAAAALGGVPVGTFIGRDNSLSVADNLREAERVLPPLVDYAGERGVKLMIENCVMEGWHPDGYPGQPRLLARALGVDVRARALAQLRPVAPAVDRDRPGRRRCSPTSTASSTRTPRTPRPSRPSATATASSAAPRPASPIPWDMGWWRFRIPGLGEVDFRRYVDTLYEGGFDGVLSVEHEDPVWGGTPGEGRGRARDRPPQPATAGGRLMAVAAPAAAKVLEVRGLVKEYPGVQGAAGRRLRRPRGRGPLPARAQRRRQVDPDQVRLRRGRADRGRDPRRAASRCPTGDPAGDARAAAWRRSTRSSTWSRT